MPMLLVRAVTQRQTDYRTFKKSLVDALGPSRVKELAKFFTPTSDEEEKQPCQQQDEMQEAF